MSEYNYRSQTLPYAAGRIPVPLNFLPRRGERGGRLVITRIDVEATLQIDTPAGVTVTQRDLCDFVKQVEIRDAAGYRRNMSGAHTMIMAQHHLGRRFPDLPASLIANTADQQRTVFFPILFSRPDDFGTDDFAMPVEDLLDGGSIDVSAPTIADINATGGAITAIDASPASFYVVSVWCREEFDVQLKARDEVNFINQQAAATIDLPVLQNALRSLFLHIRNTNGGTDLTTAITDLTVDAYRYLRIPRRTLTETYLMNHDAPRVLTDGWAYNVRCLPIVWEQLWSKARDHVRIDGSLLGRLTTSAAVGTLLYHVATPKDPRVMANALASNNVKPSDPRVKTVGKSARDPRGWGQLGAFMPWKVPRSE